MGTTVPKPDTICVNSSPFEGQVIPVFEIQEFPTAGIIYGMLAKPNTGTHVFVRILQNPLLLE